ncbi:hypothetical protein ATANTOWER_001692 [Ataeniobius toweri]|uniref:Uncharacterized protein n=1 Tax=Ataeniobius toweri TaxID=208326 RepID=A0ABU7BEY9_9TELE|nr:hypothetical protein [Ataeniobius toweri]
MFLCIIRSPGSLSSSLEKVGQLLFMENQHLTINHESNVGTARQKHRRSISCPGNRSKCHCFTHSWTTEQIVLFLSTSTGGSTVLGSVYAAMSAAMSPSEVDCYWCTLSSLCLLSIQTVC